MARSGAGGSFVAGDLLGAALEWRGEPGQLGAGLGAPGFTRARPTPAPVS